MSGDRWWSVATGWRPTKALTVEEAEALAVRLDARLDDLAGLLHVDQDAREALRERLALEAHRLRASLVLPKEEAPRVADVRKELKELEDLARHLVQRVEKVSGPALGALQDCGLNAREAFVLYIQPGADWQRDSALLQPLVELQSAAEKAIKAMEAQRDNALPEGNAAPRMAHTIACWRIFQDHRPNAHTTYQGGDFHLFTRAMYEVASGEKLTAPSAFYRAIRDLELPKGRPIG